MQARWDLSRLSAKKTVHERCDELLVSLANLQSGKEDFRSSGFFEFLPSLLSEIFGFENKAYDGEELFCSHSLQGMV